MYASRFDKKLLLEHPKHMIKGHSLESAVVADEPLPDSREACVAAVLGGELGGLAVWALISDYVGHPDAQRSVAEEYVDSQIDHELGRLGCTAATDYVGTSTS